MTAPKIAWGDDDDGNYKHFFSALKYLEGFTKNLIAVLTTAL